MYEIYQEGYPHLNNQYSLNYRPRHSFDYRKQVIHRKYATNNEEYWCETCDRGFPTADILERHKKQHQKCNIDGCQFVAHPKVITKHIQMQHASGLYKKIANINNPEEIKKWREERKKRYPTKINIEKKAAEQEEKINRGEKIGLQQNRNFKTDFKSKRKANFDCYIKKKQKDICRNKPLALKKAFIQKKPQYELQTAESFRKLKPFAGISEIILDFVEDQQEEEPNSNFVIDDEDEILKKESQDIEQCNEPKICGALSSLISNYESSDEDMNPNESKSTPLLKIQTDSKNEVNINDISSIKSDDDNGPEEIKINKNTSEVPYTEPTKSEGNSNLKKNGNKIHTKIKSTNFKRTVPRVPSTLLQKLLHKEIQQERNIVLQCIRYIVKNNFFDSSMRPS